MASDLEQLHKELETINKRRNEIRQKLSLKELSSTEQIELRNLLEEVYEDERDLERLIKEQEDGIKHDELLAEAQRHLNERSKLERELKDKNDEEKKAYEKKIIQLTAVIQKALADAEQLGRVYEDTGDDDDDGGYGYYDNGHDHLAGANGYNSY